MFALFTNQGTNGQVEYMTVAIQDRGLKRGGRVIASKVFHRRDFSSPEGLLSTAMDWATQFRIRSVKITEDLCPPDVGYDGQPAITAFN